MNNQYVTPTKVHGFRFWCQKVIPLVFDDSLSYYEVLCKLTHFMNEFSESLNQTIDGLLELQEYFEEFKEEVNKTLEDIEKLAYNLDGIYRLDLNADYETEGLTNKEKENLKDILNDMIKKEVVKPIVLNVKNKENVTLYSNIIYTDNEFINNVKNNQMYIIDFKSYYQNRGVRNRLDYLIFQITEYTISDGLIDNIITVGAHYNNVSFLPLDGSFAFTPTLENQPATKGYVDSHSGGGSTNNLYKQIEVQDLANLTQSELALLVTYFQDCINDDTGYVLVIRDNAEYDNMPFKICNFKNFQDFKNETDTTGDYQCWFPIYASIQAGGEIYCGDLNIIVNHTLDHVDSITSVGYTGKADTLQNMITINQNIKNINLSELNNPYSSDCSLLIEYLNNIKNTYLSSDWNLPISIYDETAKTSNFYMPYGLNDLISGTTGQTVYLTSYIRRVSAGYEVNIHSLSLNVDTDNNGNISIINYVGDNTWTEELMTSSNVYDKVYNRIHFNEYQSVNMSSMQNGCIMGISMSNIDWNDTGDWEVIGLRPYFYRPGEAIEYIAIDESDYTWSMDYNNGANPEGYLHFSMSAVSTNPPDTAYLVLRITAVKKTAKYENTQWIPW